METYLNNFRYVEFLISFGCNYNCSYCFWVDRLKKENYMFREKGPLKPRNTFRKLTYETLRRIGVMQYADALLNYPLADWKDLLRGIFKGRNAYLSFTGGEPLLLLKAIFEIIETVAGVIH